MKIFTALSVVLAIVLLVESIAFALDIPETLKVIETVKEVSSTISMHTSKFRIYIQLSIRILLSLVFFSLPFSIEEKQTRT